MNTPIKRYILALQIVARFLLFFYSIDIDRLEVDLGYICDRDPNFSKGVTVELE